LIVGADVRGDADRVRAHLPSGDFESFLVDIEQRDPRSGLCEALGDAKTEACAAARHKRSSLAQSHDREYRNVIQRAMVIDSGNATTFSIDDVIDRQASSS
jgi:hypothetical protein